MFDHSTELHALLSIGFDALLAKPINYTCCFEVLHCNITDLARVSKDLAMLSEGSSTSINIRQSIMKL